MLKALKEFYADVPDGLLAKLEVPRIMMRRSYPVGLHIGQIGFFLFCGHRMGWSPLVSLKHQKRVPRSKDEPPTCCFYR